MTDLRKTFIGSKAKLPPTSCLLQNKGCHCISCSVLIHTLFLPITVMPTQWIHLCLWLEVCGLTISLFLTQHFVSTFLMTLWISPLGTGWGIKWKKFLINSLWRQTDSAPQICKYRGSQEIQWHEHQKKNLQQITGSFHDYSWINPNSVEMVIKEWIFTDNPSIVMSQVKPLLFSAWGSWVLESERAWKTPPCTSLICPCPTTSVATTGS